jgi:hypothetical protein
LMEGETDKWRSSPFLPFQTTTEMDSLLVSPNS